jgi:hypothetical protein
MNPYAWHRIGLLLALLLLLLSHPCISPQIRSPASRCILIASPWSG